MPHPAHGTHTITHTDRDTQHGSHQSFASKLAVQQSDVQSGFILGHSIKYSCPNRGRCTCTCRCKRTFAVLVSQVLLNKASQAPWFLAMATPVVHMFCSSTPMQHCSCIILLARKNTGGEFILSSINNLLAAKKVCFKVQPIKISPRLG